MVGMLGSRGSDNTLTGLVNIVADPAKYKKALAELKTATEKHRAERDAAAKQKAEAEAAVAKVNERLAYLETIDTKVIAAQKQLNAAKSALDAKQADFEKKVANFAVEMKAAQDANAAKAAAAQKELDTQKAQFEQEKKGLVDATEKAAALISKNKAELNALAGKLAAKKDELDNREATVTKLELDVRTRLKKVNELFPIS